MSKAFRSVVSSSANTKVDKKRWRQELQKRTARIEQNRKKWKAAK